jgi:uncharacterized coiled-coil protein SlyX
MKKRSLSLAVSAVVTALSLPLAAQGATVEELSAQLEAMQAQMSAMQAELKVLREKDAAASQFTVVETDYGELKEEVMVLREDVDDLDERLMEPEKHAALDGLNWGGDFRVQAHSIEGTIPDHVNGLHFQNQVIGMMQQFGMLGEEFTFNELKDAFIGMQALLPMLPPEQQAFFQGEMQRMAQNAFVKGYDVDNDILRTTRLRLEMKGDVGENVDFYARLNMYKVWGDSTGVQVFNGQPTSINWDGTNGAYPNSDDMIHVDRAYFNWNRIGGTGTFLSIGRRPSTDGVPVNFRNDEPRGGTPMGSLFNYQYDGLTLGYKFNDYSTIRLCYGVGFESEWGNGYQLKRPADRLDDSIFYGLVWDVWDSPKMYIHLIAARAEDISDGFPATTILPVNPVTGEPIEAAVPIRFEPGGTIGNMDLAGFVITRRDFGFDYFLSYGWMESDPTDYTGPFGGMFTDPFDTPESESGDMIYLGGRYSFNQDRTKIGLEWNSGSKYWFNFALAEDDFISPKTSARGDVWEAYVTHRIRDRFIFKLAYIDYSYDYSGSGWLLGAPKKLDSTPVVGFPTYDEASMWTLGLTARF